MPPLRQKGAADLMDADISFPLARLFDPYNMDEVPEKNRMEQFEHRDLAHIKHYKAAVKIFGGPLSRKRVIVAPPMETPLKHQLGMYMTRKSPPPAKAYNADLNPQIPPEKPLPEELVIAKQAQEREDRYKAWFKERQKFRNDLENMGLNMDWLSKKPNKSVLERRVLRQLKEAAGQKLDDNMRETPTPAPRSESGAFDLSGLPTITVETPLALKILEQHVIENKLRLIDLFTAVDKDKNWKISREEFMKVCNERTIPISATLLEDMLITLDMNQDEELDYRELARGMEAWKKQKREEKHRDLSRESTSLSAKSGRSSKSRHLAREDERVSSGEKSGSRHSTPSRLSPSQRDKVKKRIISTIDTSSSYRPDTQGNDKQSPVSRGEITNRTTISKSEGEPDSDCKKVKPKSASLSKPGTAKSENTTDRTEATIITSDAESGTKSEKISNKVVVINSGTKLGQTRQGSSSSERTLSPKILEPPDLDVRLEQMILPTEEAMVDLRKRDREGLKRYNSSAKGIPNTIKTGSRAMDKHCMKSTLGGEIGEMVDAFRQTRLQEYFEIVDVCEQNGVALTRSLLEKVLLFPPDIPHNEIKKIRPPDAAPLLSAHFAEPPKRPRTPIEVKHKDKVRRSKSGKLLIDTRHEYPTNLSIAPHGYKMNLSTGRAVIRRKVDCWMTFEEYEELTKHLAIRYQHLHDWGSENAFWPGHLLDKVKLAMPPYDKPFKRDRENSIFTRVHRTKAVNYGYEPKDMWPVNDDGHVQIGIHDHYRNKYI